MKIDITPEIRQELELAYRAAKDKRPANKINTVLLLDADYGSQEVASILRIKQSTVTRTANSFLENGFEDLIRNPFTGGVSKLSEDQLNDLEKFAEANLCSTTDEIVQYVLTEHQVKYTRSGMGLLLKRLGFVYKKPVLIPGNPDPEIQGAFIEYYHRLRSTMKENDKLYFLDGVHPQHNTAAAHGWIKKGQESKISTNTGRKRININGALDPDSLEVIAWADETLDAKSTISLFKMIEEQNPKANKIVLIGDNARYYYNGDVLEYINNSKQLEFVHLPPCCPNLNLTERLWRFMKKKVLHNKYYPTFSDYKKAIGDFFQNLPSYDELKDLMTENFQTIMPCDSG